MAGALSGIKIVEAASYVTGPLRRNCWRIWEQVVKIEEPKRGALADGARGTMPRLRSLNRNKKHNADLRTDEGRVVALN
jgi:crotonobetainyl-CoA:carnitine CoA-transferase CaiB-like acyl-CoA transferase